VNAPIARLFALIVVLFGLLVVFTSRWTVFEADELRDNALNRRELLAQQRVRRGAIRASNGGLLARSLERGDGTFTRTYPTGSLFSHAVGYSYITTSRAGLERSQNDVLSGRADGELGSIFDRLSGSSQRGDEVRTTLHERAQRVALQQLGDRRGAVVALDPRTGAVRVMASVPQYDPNAVGAADDFTALNRDDNAPLLNRTTQAGYPPGSTFKVVTAIAAIDSGRYRPDSRVDGRNGKEISGVPLNNFGGQSYGDITLTEALTNSVNTVWADVGEKLGKDTMSEYMDRLGFGEQVRVDLPSDERRASGPFRNGRALPVTSRFVDVGRMAIGQDLLAVTPLQMAMVAAAVANDGELMEPHIVGSVVDADGRRDDVDPRSMSRVMSSASARQVRDMMANVVREGSGTAAALQGIEVGGKTGTAEVDRPCGPNQAWFIAFAPVSEPRVAVAATLECTEGTGGVVAAPIAKAVMQELLR
jgi:penicillin-binding protein A